MHIAVVYSTDFGSVSPGGIRNYIDAVGANAPDDVQVTYIGHGRLAGPLPREQDSYLGVPVHRALSNHTNAAFVAGLRTARIDWHGYDRTVVHRVEHGVFLPRRRSQRVVQVLHGGTYFAWHAHKRPFSAAYPLLEAVAVARSSATLAVAPNHLGHLTRRSARKIMGITTTYDSTTFRAPARLAPLGCALAVVARLVPEKRVDLALRAGADVGWPVHVFGSGPDEPRLRRVAEQLDITVHWHGHSGAREIAATYAAVRPTLVVTSLFEGFPLAVIEAAAMGVPVVGLRAPGVSEAVAAVGGSVVETPAHLAAAARSAQVSGGGRSPSEISEAFAAPAVGARFWRDVLAAG